MRFRALATLAFLGSLALPAGASAAPKYRVTVTRDSYGIPHITARNFTSLGYGEGYAFAQDNLCTFAADVVTLRSERTRYFGADGYAIQYANGARDPNPVSDMYWAWVRSSGRIARLTRHVLPQVRAVYSGWVAGYNAWLRSPRFRDPTCKGKPWVTPITVQDLYLRGYQFETIPSSGSLETGIVAAAPPSGKSARSLSPSRVNLVALRRHFDGGADLGVGSNAIGLGSKGVRPGIKGMVFSNPHFPWIGTERLWMMQLTVPGQYNALGYTVLGFPLVGAGFNQNVAFTSTDATGYRFVPIQLKLANGDPTAYLVDGRKYQMTRRVVRLNGTSHTFYSTMYGPVFDLPQAGYTWTSSTAYAIFDADAQMLGSTADQYFDMARAKTVGGVLSVLRHYLSNPEFNIIAADDHGQTLYSNVGAYPGVTQSLANRCIPPGLPQLVYADSGLITLDGSRSSCHLRSYKGAPRPDILGGQELPATIRRDWVENSNDSYWLANPRHPFPHLSPILGPWQVAQLFRTRQGNLMVEARLAGNDGLGPPGFDISNMERDINRFENYGGKLVTRQLAAACRSHPNIKLTSGPAVNVSAACPVLQHYNGTGRTDAHGAWLFTTWLYDIPVGFPWSDSLNAANPLNTPRILDPNAPYTLQPLAEAVQELRAHHIPLNATLGQVVYTRQTGHRLAVPGCFGCYETIDASHGPAADFGAPYGEITFGDSAIMFIELTRKGPRAQGTVTYSEATDPTSRWHGNLTRLYARGRYVPFLFTPRALRHDRGAHTLHLTSTG